MSIPGTSVEVKKFYFENKKQQQQQIIIEGCFCQFLSDDYCIEVQNLKLRKESKSVKSLIKDIS